MAVAFLIAGVLASIGPPDRAAVAATSQPGRPRLLVIGDSIILGTQGNIAADLPEWDVVFDAAVSRSTADGLDVLAAHGSDFSAVVVALGANDGETPGVFTPRVAALLDVLAGVPLVIWLTIHEARPYYAQANAIIREQVSRHPNALVADWNAAVRDGDVGGDGLHLTGQGSVDMAAWVAAVVRLASVPTTTTTTTTTTTAPPTTVTAPPSEPPPAAAPTTNTPARRPADDARPDGSDREWVGALLVATVAAAGVVALVIARRRRAHRPET